MKKNTILLITAILFAFTMNAQSFYDYTVKDIDGNDYPLSQLEGKKVMVVNVASECGLTPQYEQLQEVYNKYRDQNFIIIAFPANDFKNQEPGSNSDIKQFCTENFGVTFPMMAKITVTGEDTAPVYQWLTKKHLNGVEDSKVKWNFQKYLIGEEGQLEMVVSPLKKPDSDKIIKWIEE